MNLNELSPALGSKFQRKRLGRGIGSGWGKTSGKGHKGQKARAGGFHKINFEGGQMPIQRRLPKMGFKSRLTKITRELTLTELAKIGVQLNGEQYVDRELLSNSGMIKESIRRVKVILSGEITVAVRVKGLKVSKGAREAIEKVGGSIE